MFNLFRRRRGGISVLFLVIAVCGLLSACMTLFLGVPASIIRAREVSNLPIVSAAEVSGLTAGTKGIFTVQIPAEAEVDGVNGLALYYIEQRQKGTRTPASEGESNTSSSTSWEVVRPPAGTFEMSLTSGQMIVVNIPSSASFMNAETVEEAADDTVERRAVGFRAGQTLAVEGVWESNEILTAQTLYYGAPSEFVSTVRSAPGSMFLFSIICGVISMSLLIIGGILRFLGR